MTDLELIEKFKQCQLQSDADEWDCLAAEFYARGYYLNAMHAWNTADSIRGCSFAQALPARVGAEAEARG